MIAIDRFIEHRSPFADTTIESSSGASDEERAGEMDSMEACKIDVASIHHSIRPDLEGDLVEHGYIDGLGVRNPHKHGDSDTQVDHNVSFDARLASAEMHPGKQRQT